MALRGLTETKEGRLVVIAVVAGTLMIALAVGNLVMAGAADAVAADVRERLRNELAVVPDEVIDGYPESAEVIEAAAAEAVQTEPAQVLGATRPDRGPVVVTVQSGWAWHIRCIEAELRGDAVVLTYVSASPC